MIIYIAICCCLVVVSVSVIVSVIIISSKKNPAPVQGFYSGNWGENLNTKNETLESCLTWAKTKNYPMVGFRNANHPDPEYRHSCFGYTKANIYTGDPTDITHLMICTDRSKSILTGCTEA